jgi:hypothetical protein
MVLVATPQDRPLLKFYVVGKPRKNLRDDVLLACVEFLLEPLLPFLPRVSVDRRFDLDQKIVDGMVRHNVKLSLMAAVGQLANLDISPHKVAFELKPLGNELFQVICHFIPLSLNGPTHLPRRPVRGEPWKAMMPLLSGAAFGSALP